MLWESDPDHAGTRSQCNVTYSRKRAAARRAAYNSVGHNEPRKSTLCHTLLRKPLKRSFTQLHLDAGQLDFTCTACRVCGFVYAKGKEEDDKLHAAFHDTALHGITFQGWQHERIVKVDSHKHRVLLVLPEDSEKHSSKVQEICSTLEDQLGLCKGWLLSGTWQVYLYILSNKRLVGCVVTERITSASPVVSDEAYTSANQSLTAPAVMSPLPSVNLQPLTPMSAPPLGQPRNSTSDVPDRLAASCMKPSAASATGVTSPCPAHEQSHQSKKLSASQCLQVCGAAQAHSPAHTAVNRGSMQQRKQKGTLLTRWLVASKYNAAADGSASPMHATTAPSADSAAACNAAMQNPAAIGAEGMTQEWSRSACPDQPSTASSLPWCSSTVQAAQSMEDYRGVGQSQLPNTSGFAAQTQAQASSLTAAHQSSPADCLSLDSQIVPPLHCSLTSNSGRSSSSPAVQPAYSRPQHAIMLDTAQSVPASCGVKVMWVSSDHQRKGVATQLLDAVRCSCTAGFIIPRHQLAFSQPTWAGLCFAQSYTGRPHFLVYQG